jgi:hypothetical protein
MAIASGVNPANETELPILVSLLELIEYPVTDPLVPLFKI